MSTTEKLPQPIDEAAATPVRGAGRASRRGTVALAAIAVTVAAFGAAAALTQRNGVDAPPPAPTGAITLPPTVAGLSPIAEGFDQTRRPAWLLAARTAGKGSAVVARTYGTTPTARSIRLVAARTDLTGQLEMAWAATPGNAVGEAHCTNNTIIVKNSQPRIRPTVMLCWRTSADLTAYSLIIDPKATTPVTEADGAAALDALWKATQ